MYSMCLLHQLYPANEGVCFSYPSSEMHEVVMICNGAKNDQILAAGNGKRLLVMSGVTPCVLLLNLILGWT